MRIRIGMKNSKALRSSRAAFGSRQRIARTMSTQATPATYETILVEKKGSVGWITLNRTKQLNALNTTLQNEVMDALRTLDKDMDVGAVVITGSQKAFAAGADIKEMASETYSDVRNRQMFGEWDQMATVKKPIIAAVSGFALGGGCELAMMCDMIIAGDNAVFGQPEIKLGTIPGIGGTQRLTRAVGKSKAMEMILTGDPIDAREAEKLGLVARVVPSEELLEHTLKIATKIASNSQPVNAMAKQAVNYAFESGLTQGVQFERSLFYGTFAMEDQKEGMAKFIQKEAPQWKNK